ncbi:spindle and kinetochore-associated protein 2-like [Centruroides vittatus]|uniref:spindle and kinetochore-associated protein 2-like n=1 Tax=Centruroides vittatus TaxID=120091 RepID=UPI00350E9978
MEATVSKLEALFQQAESDLNSVSCQLETELTRATINKSGDQVNPVKVIEAVQQIKKDYSKLLKEVAELQATQKKAINNLQEELKVINEKLEKLKCEECSKVSDPLPP